MNSCVTTQKRDHPVPMCKSKRDKIQNFTKGCCVGLVGQVTDNFKIRKGPVLDLAIMLKGPVTHPVISMYHMYRCVGPVCQGKDKFNILDPLT